MVRCSSFVSLVGDAGPAESEPSDAWRRACPQGATDGASAGVGRCWGVPRAAAALLALLLPHLLRTVHALPPRIGVVHNAEGQDVEVRERAALLLCGVVNELGGAAGTGVNNAAGAR